MVFVVDLGDGRGSNAVRKGLGTRTEDDEPVIFDITSSAATLSFVGYARRSEEHGD